MKGRSDYNLHKYIAVLNIGSVDSMCVLCTCVRHGRASFLIAQAICASH